MRKISSTLSKNYFVGILTILLMFILINQIMHAQSAESSDEKPDWINGRPEACTSILVGKKASFDGSVMTSHTDDSHRDRTWMDIRSSKYHEFGSKKIIRTRKKNDETAMPSYKFVRIGEIPQVKHTYGFINTAYPCMNEHQLAIGESTFGGRLELKSEGLIDCYQLVELILERCKNVREALELTDTLLSKYGWNDYGECLTICDKNEAWALEIIGPGKGNLGVVWAAQRLPDNHVSVNANASRIRTIDLDNPEYFRASKNVFKVAQDSGWWNPQNGPFEFCYAYDSDGRNSLWSRRREWRVLSLLAPSLKLHPNAENYPFSVKPDTLVTLQKMVGIFKDYYEGTPYNMIKDLTLENDKGEIEIHPNANPFMPYDMNKLFNINGGLGWYGERTIARWYTNYGHITQSRDWLPNDIGGVVWFAWDNIATSIYIPIYCSVTDAPQSFKVPGRTYGYTNESAWWAFNRLSGLASQRWGEMRFDVDSVWGPWQSELFENQTNIETIAKNLRRKNPTQTKKYLTDYFIEWGEKVVKRAWKLGDELWTKYDEKF